MEKWKINTFSKIYSKKPDAVEKTIGLNLKGTALSIVFII